MSIYGDAAPAAGAPSVFSSDGAVGLKPAGTGARCSAFATDVRAGCSSMDAFKTSRPAQGCLCVTIILLGLLVFGGDREHERCQETGAEMKALETQALIDARCIADGVGSESCTCATDMLELAHPELATAPAGGCSFITGNTPIGATQWVEVPVRCPSPVYGQSDGASSSTLPVEL
jgi:hypothetical protein